jgi:tryptophanyl-tRNA synthetase
VGILRNERLTHRQLKAICIKYLQEYVAGFQERRAKVTDEVVNEFMAARPLEWKGNPKVPRADLVVPVSKPVDGEAKPAEGSGGMTKNALKKLAKQAQVAQKKAEKEAAKAAGKDSAAAP